MLTALPLAARAQAPGATRIKVGAVTIDSAKFSYAGALFRLYGGVHMTSVNYDLQARTVDAYLKQGAGTSLGASSLVKATAEGDPARGTQVMGRFEQVEQAQTIKLYGDHAVYTPDARRPNGGTVHFTGHVKMIVSAPQALAEPSTTTAEQVTVLLGQGPDYPQVEGDNGHMVLTPLQ